MAEIVDDVKVGSPAPGFRLLDGSGRMVELSAYRSKSWVVLFFVREFR